MSSTNKVHVWSGRMVEESVSVINPRKRKRANFDIDEFDSDEFDVANTLIDLLPSLVIKSRQECLLNSCLRFSYAWGNKRRRSAVVNPPCKVAATPSTAVTTTVVKSFATSPDTPLGLSSSDCDNYNNRKFDKSIKKAKEKLQMMVGERIQTQLTLKVGIEKGKQHLKELKAQNCGLKLERHKVMEGKTTVNDMVQAGPSTKVYNQQQSSTSHHQVYFPNRMVHTRPYFGGCTQLGLRGFDLNVSAEEMGMIENGLQPLDREMIIRNVMMNRAIAAQARHNRIVINKSKKVARVK